MKFTILCPFDPNGIPGYPMTSEEGVQLFDGEGSGYSRIGSVPEADQNMMLVTTSQKTYDLMVQDSKIKILQVYNEVTKNINLVSTSKIFNDAMTKCKVSQTQMVCVTAAMKATSASVEEVIK